MFRSNYLHTYLHPWAILFIFRRSIYFSSSNPREPQSETGMYFLCLCFIPISIHFHFSFIWITDRKHSVDNFWLSLVWILPFCLSVVVWILCRVNRLVNYSSFPEIPSATVIISFYISRQWIVWDVFTWIETDAMWTMRNWAAVICILLLSKLNTIYLTDIQASCITTRWRKKDCIWFNISWRIIKVC